MDTFAFSTDDLLNQWALIGMPFLIILIGTLIARFTIRGQLMEDMVLRDAFYWLFMNRLFLEVLIGSLSFVASIIAIFTIIRKWGDGF